ncbi:MAG TPA: FGGY-family carbohydrate kinase, partial [Mycobacterium sp.]|nr:FGGY-family carbohydrate kinase [Mycobacterium sp.]
MTELRATLSVWSAVGVSVALMAPSMAININPQGTAAVVGRAVPLTFLLASVAVLLIAHTFVRLSQRFNHAGSVYAFVGLTLKHTRGHLVRAIMEGVTYSLRDCLAIIEEQGVAVKQIRASGGGARSSFWRQMQADVLGKTVVSMAADEGPGYGVALLAAVGAGEFKSVPEACEATVKTVGQTKP